LFWRAIQRGKIIGRGNSDNEEGRESDDACYDGKEKLDDHTQTRLQGDCFQCYSAQRLPLSLPKALVLDQQADEAALHPKAEIARKEMPGFRTSRYPVNGGEVSSSFPQALVGASRQYDQT